MKALRSVRSVMVLLVATMACSARAVTLTQAQVTETKKAVSYKTEAAAERSAKVGDTVRGADVLRTGERSMAEVEFNDQTISRLGSKTVFTFKNATREVDLKEGLMLFHCPRGQGGARINTAAVTAAITGTTLLAEALPNLSKFIFLEGTGKFKVGKETVNVGDAEMLIVYPNGKWVKAPIDLAMLFRTSEFLQAAKERLKKIDEDGRIARNLKRQADDLKAGRLQPVGYYIAGIGDKLIGRPGQPEQPTTMLADAGSPWSLAPELNLGNDPARFATGTYLEEHAGTAPSGGGGGGIVDVGGTGLIRGQLV